MIPLYKVDDVVLVSCKDEERMGEHSGIYTLSMLHSNLLLIFRHHSRRVSKAKLEQNRLLHYVP